MGYLCAIYVHNEDLSVTCLLCIHAPVLSQIESVQSEVAAEDDACRTHACHADEGCTDLPPNSMDLQKSEGNTASTESDTASGCRALLYGGVVGVLDKHSWYEVHP